MNLRRITSRTAALGAATALGATALVGLTATSATAATVENTYVCVVPNLFEGSFDLTVEGALPVDAFYASAIVPSMLNVKAAAPVAAETAELLTSLGVTGLVAKDFAFDMGSAKVPVPLQGNFTSGDEGTVWNATGTNEPFTTPAPGTYDVTMPEAFSMTTLQGETEAVALSCEIAEGQEPQAIAADFMLGQQATATSASNVKVKQGKKAVIKAKVTSTTWEDSALGGKAVAKKGKKTLATAKVNKKGVAKLNLGKKLKPGKHKITVTYTGNESFSESSTTVTVTVKKAKKGKK